MNNISIWKQWEDTDILELKISAQSKYVVVNQSCYIQNTDLEAIGNSIKEFSFNFYEFCYVEFGKKLGNFTPAFSLEFFPADATGKVQIEVDMEIDDNDERKHRCSFYIQSEIGLVEKFGNGLIKMATQENLNKVSLNI